MTTTADDIPYFPATAPAELADAGTAVALIEPVLAQLADVVARVTPEALAGPTPCDRYDVSALRDHVLGWLQFFSAAFADPARTRPRPEPDAYRAADDDRDLADVVRRSSTALTDALRAGGVLDGQVVLSQSRMDGPAAFGMVLGEYLVHGWDLAAAVGAPWTPPEQACESALEFFRGMVLPEYRGGEGGFFGEEVPVPADAPALERLLGFAGRRPGWPDSSRSGA